MNDGNRGGTDDGRLIPKHGGFRDLKTFQLSELIYDVTVRFCHRFVSPRSRTFDQMVQAARSGRQNIAEGSVDSATSKKIELKLTGIAKGSQQELALDFEDFLRQRELPLWAPDHPALARFRALRCDNLHAFRVWVADEVRRVGYTDSHGRTPTDTDRHRHRPTVRARPCSSVSVRAPSVSPLAPQDVLPATLAANAALSLLNVSTYLLERQIQSLAREFERNGGFTERLYRRRSALRDRPA
ncbi:MAG: four helix bundle suffix domain-containing protein [Verrucomicrobia bacterium]|nr:four helix bundle suffix domain-containing protein [Verrucomicrobiota bacterium]